MARQCGKTTPARQLVPADSPTASWEGFILEKVIAESSADEVYFWGTHNGAELDLVRDRARAARMAGDALRSLQERGVVAVRAADLPQSHRERLVRHGFLLPVIKGWYVADSPDRPAGDSTAWYASFWRFCGGYLQARFGGPRACRRSMLHAGNRMVPGQLLVRAPRGRNRVTPLLHGTSLLEVRAAMPAAADVVEVDGMRAFRPAAALVACPARFFQGHPVDGRAALALVPDASDGGPNVP